MRRFSRYLATLGAASALLVSALVLAEEPKAEAPRPAPAAKRKAITVRGVVEGIFGAPRGQAAEKEVRKVEVKKTIIFAPTAPVLTAPAGAAVAIEDNNPQVLQLMQQFRPILTAELHLLRSVCDLTKDQRRQMAKAGESALKEAAKTYVGKRRMGGIGQNHQVDPLMLVQERLVAAAKEMLPPEQAARYQKETEERAAGRKQAAIRNAVAKLDEDLILTAAQREKLCDALSDHWSDGWLQPLEASMIHGDQFFPSLPDQYITPILDQTQRDIWKNTQRNRAVINGFFGFFGLGGMTLEEDLPDNDDEPSSTDGARRSR